MRKDLKLLTEEQKIYLAKRIYKEITKGNNLIYTDSEICKKRILKAFEIKNVNIDALTTNLE